MFSLLQVNNPTANLLCTINSSLFHANDSKQLFKHFLRRTYPHKSRAKLNQFSSRFWITKDKFCTFFPVFNLGGRSGRLHLWKLDKLFTLTGDCALIEESIQLKNLILVFKVSLKDQANFLWELLARWLGSQIITTSYLQKAWRQGKQTLLCWAANNTSAKDMYEKNILFINNKSFRCSPFRNSHSQEKPLLDS